MINPSSGAFSWAVPSSQAAGDYAITVRVTDNGSPPLSDAKTFTIHVNTGIKPPALRISDVTLTEGNAGTKAATFTVSLSAAALFPVTVKYATANGTAAAGSDYTAASGTLTFAARQTSKPVRVTITGNTAVEPDERFYVNLSAPTNAVLADAQGLGKILNDDTALRISDVTLTEGNAGTKAATFTVSLSAAALFPVTVKYATANGTAAAGSDYTAASGTLTFAAGETSKPVRVTITGNTAVEPDERFYVNLSAPTNAVLADAQGLGKILNDDTALRISDVTLTEGNAGTKAATFTVSLSAAALFPVTVKYATANGTAAAGSDYTAASGTLTFAAGETSKTVSVTITGDTAVEPDETFYVNLSAPTNAVLADAQGLGKIRNDDTALRISDVTLTEGNAGTKAATFTVSLSADRTVRVFMGPPSDDRTRGIIAPRMIPPLR